MMKPICCLIVLLSYCEIVLSGTAVRPSIAAEGTIVAEFVGYQEKTTPSAIREEIARIENLD